MTILAITDFILRWFHILFGIAWIGLLYYFNFVQMEYFKEADPSAKADATAKLVPRALWYFRWAAMFTFLTGFLLLLMIGHGTGGSFSLGLFSLDITFGALMGTLMMLNVWLVIWPNQKKVIAGAEDAAAAGAKAACASRTNTLLSLPMLYFMVSSTHFVQGGAFAYNNLVESQAVSILALVVGLLIIGLIELNAVHWRRMTLGPLAFLSTVSGVIHSSLALVVIFALTTNLL